MCLASICFFQNALHNALHSTFSVKSDLFLFFEVANPAGQQGELFMPRHV